MSNLYEVRLTFKKEGGRLLRRGQYSSAVTITKTGEITVPMTIIKPSLNEEIIQILNLGEQFIDWSLKNPPKHIRMSAKKWNNLSQKVRIQYHAVDIAHDLDCTVQEVEFVN